MLRLGLTCNITTSLIARQCSGLSKIPMSKISKSILDVIPQSSMNESLWQHIKRQVSDEGRKIIILDDDPIGSTSLYDVDILLDYSKTSIKTQFDKGNKAFSIITNLRSFSYDNANKIIKRIVSNIQEVYMEQEYRPPLQIINRLSSNLKGHFPLEINAIVSTFREGYDGIIICPASCDKHRITKDNIQYIIDGDYLVPVHEYLQSKQPISMNSLTDISKKAAIRNPNRPSVEMESLPMTSNLTEFVKMKCGEKNIVSLSIEDIRLGGPNAVENKLELLQFNSVVIANGTDTVTNFILNLVQYTFRTLSLYMSLFLTRIQYHRTSKLTLKLFLLAIHQHDVNMFTKGLLQAESTGQNFLYAASESFIASRCGLEPRSPLIVQRKTSPSNNNNSCSNLNTTSSSNSSSGGGVGVFPTNRQVSATGSSNVMVTMNQVKKLWNNKVITLQKSLMRILNKGNEDSVDAVNDNTVVTTTSTGGLLILDDSDITVTQQLHTLRTKRETYIFKIPIGVATATATENRCSKSSSFNSEGSHESIQNNEINDTIARNNNTSSGLKQQYNSDNNDRYFHKVAPIMNDIKTSMDDDGSVIDDKLLEIARRINNHLSVGEDVVVLLQQPHPLQQQQYEYNSQSKRVQYNPSDRSDNGFYNISSNRNNTSGSNNNSTESSSNSSGVSMMNKLLPLRHLLQQLQHRPSYILACGGGLGGGNIRYNNNIIKQQTQRHSYDNSTGMITNDSANENDADSVSTLTSSKDLPYQLAVHGLQLSSVHLLGQIAQGVPIWRTDCKYFGRKNYLKGTDHSSSNTSNSSNSNDSSSIDNTMLLYIPLPVDLLDSSILTKIVSKFSTARRTSASILEK